MLVENVKYKKSARVARRVIHYNSSETKDKKYKIPQKDIKDWFRDLNIETMEVQNGIDS